VRRFALDLSNNEFLEVSCCVVINDGMVGIIVFLLLLSLVALVSKQYGYDLLVKVCKQYASHPLFCTV